MKPKKKPAPASPAPRVLTEEAARSIVERLRAHRIEQLRQQIRQAEGHPRVASFVERATGKVRPPK
jgi:hypothetical protein